MPLLRHARFRARSPFRVAAAALLLAGTAGLAACSPAADAATKGADGKTVLRYQGSTGAVGYDELAEDLGYFKKVKLDWVGDVTGGPASIQAAVTGQTEYGGAFNGAIAKLAASGAKVTSVITYYGADKQTHGGYYTLSGSKIKAARDLIGKKVAVNTLGAQSEFVTREWLARGGLTPAEIKKVELVVVPPVNAEQVLRAGQVDVAGLSGILQDKALSRGGITKLFGEDDLFGDFGYGSFIFRDDYIAKHPDEVADFTQGVARAIRWAQTTPVADVKARFTKIIKQRAHPGETADNIQFWKSSSIPTPGGVIQPQEIKIWVDWLVKDGQLKEGQLDSEKLYTNKFNPYSNGTFQPDAGPDGKPVK